MVGGEWMRIDDDRRRMTNPDKEKRRWRVGRETGSAQRFRILVLSRDQGVGGVNEKCGKVNQEGRFQKKKTTIRKSAATMGAQAGKEAFHLL